MSRRKRHHPKQIARPKTGGFTNGNYLAFTGFGLVMLANALVEFLLGGVTWRKWFVIPLSSVVGQSILGFHIVTGCALCYFGVRGMLRIYLSRK